MSFWINSGEWCVKSMFCLKVSKILLDGLHISELMFVAKTGKPLTVVYLLGFGASVSAVDNQG